LPVNAPAAADTSQPVPEFVVALADLQPQLVGSMP
jgi:hypothetical protein